MTKITSDLLQRSVRVPTSTGFTTVNYFNSGEMSNKGVEFRADYELFKNKNWRISINGNINRNVNKILELPENLDEETYTFGNGVYAQRIETDVPVGSFFGYKYLGVYQNVDATYARDVEGNIMKDVEGNNIVMQNGRHESISGRCKVPRY